MKDPHTIALLIRVEMKYWTRRARTLRKAQEWKRLWEANAARRGLAILHRETIG